MESFLKFRLVAATEVILARSSAKASQKALCVMKLSFLFKLKEIPISEYNPNLLLPNHSMALNLKENPWKLLRGHLFLMRRNKDSNSKEEKKRGKKKRSDIVLPGKECSTVTFVLPGSASFRVSFPVRLNCVFLRTLLALPLLLAMFSTEMFFYPSKVAEGSGGVVVNAGLLGADVNLLSNLFVRPLLELPWKIVSSSVQLQVLVSLKPFIADFTYESIGGHESLWWKSNNLRIWIC